MKWYYVLSDSLNPYSNLALERYLMDSEEVCNRKGSVGILFLWQNNHTIVIGRNQDIRKEINLDAFLKNGGTPARRLSGGGAVYHDKGNLNFSFIQAANSETVSYFEIIIPVLKEFGICTVFNGRNDLECSRGKVSGSARYIANNVICEHGTLLINADTSLMKQYLTPSRSKLEKHCVDSVEARVCNLTDIDPSLTAEMLKKHIINFTNACEYVRDTNSRKLMGYRKLFSHSEWIYNGINGHTQTFLKGKP